MAKRNSSLLRFVLLFRSKAEIILTHHYFDCNKKVETKLNVSKLESTRQSKKQTKI